MKRPDYLNSENNEPVARSIPVDQYQAGTGGNTFAPDAQKVLRNTYALLAMTLVFSAAMAVRNLSFCCPVLRQMPRLGSQKSCGPVSKPAHLISVVNVYP